MMMLMNFAVPGVNRNKRRAVIREKEDRA